PPDLLERLERVAERLPVASRDELDVVERDLLEQLESGPRAVRDLAAPDGRVGLVRRLRAMESRGLLSLDWTLTASGAGPRFERWLVATQSGAAAAAAFAADRPAAGRSLGPRQAAALAELAGAPIVPV